LTSVGEKISMVNWYSVNIETILRTESDLPARTRQIIEDVNRGNLTPVQALPLFAEILERYARILENIQKHIQEVDRSGILDSAESLMRLVKK